LAAIQSTLPEQFGQRHRCLFEFARRLKAIQDLADADIQSLKPCVREWHIAALPCIGTKPFEETWLDFAEGWGKVKYAAGKEPVMKIYKQSLAKPLPAEAERYEQPELQRLVGLCRELQSVSGTEPFFLTGRAAAKLIGVSHPQAARWLRLLVLDEVIKLERLGKRHHASEYRYLRG